MLLSLIPVMIAVATVAAPAAVDHSMHAAAPKKLGAEKKICKRDGATESRMGSKRICKTAAQWRGERNDGAVDDAKQMTSTKSR